MIARFHRVLFCFLFLTTISNADETLKISHGPMLGAVSEHTAAIWVRTTLPGDVNITLTEVASSNTFGKTVKTSEQSDNTAIIRFYDLKQNTDYHYTVLSGTSRAEGNITTLGPSLQEKGIRVVYGYGYKHQENRMKSGRSVFTEMASHKADLVLFIGDFPYTAKGAKREVWDGNKKIREVTGFRELTSSTPTYAIYDDHDFGPNNCDGTHRNADEALAAFKMYWPNPSYGLPGNKGIYCSFVVGDVEFFLLDGRYQARKHQSTMLGKVQLKWLFDGLRNSKSRYKVLVSGTQFARKTNDSWGGPYYAYERARLFSFIVKNNITGVLGISGDVHRSDVNRFPIGRNNYFYDFTPGALSRNPRLPPKITSSTLLHSYGKQSDNNMYGVIEFNPSSNGDTAVIFRSFSAKNGLIYEHPLSPEDLSLSTDNE